MVKRKIHYRKSEKFVEDVVVLDFETTGLSPSRNEIIQIGAMKFKGPSMVDQFSSYAKASHPIPARISEITGITDWTVKNAPPLSRKFGSVKRFYRTTYLSGP